MESRDNPDLNRLCRLCLEDKNIQEMHHIFNESLNNKIIILSGLDMQANDSLPKNICKDCRYQLEKSYFFRTVAKQSDTRLRKHIRLINQNKKSQYLHKDFKDDMEEFDEMYLEESYKYFESAQRELDQLRCEFEEQKDQIIKAEIDKIKAEHTKQPLVRHSKRNSSPSKQIPENPVVLNKLAPTRQRFQKNPVLRRKKEEKVEGQIINEFVLGNYEIEFVTQTGDVHETQQVYHVEKITEDIGFADEVHATEEIVEPIEEASSSDEDYKPPKPKKKLIQLSHVGTKSKKPILKEKSLPQALRADPLPEPADDNYFKAIDDVDDLDLDENGEKKIFQCAFEKCKERFARRQACKTHYYNHLASKSVLNGFKCKFCGKTHKVASALERHERVHTGDKPFKCDEDGCQKSFSQKEMLKRHKIIHLSIEDAPFACKQCDKKFRQKEPLRLHVTKAHSTTAVDSHPFTCSICAKNFAHSSGLSRHFLIHSGKLFSCEVCKKSFNDKSALKRHVGIHKK